MTQTDFMKTLERLNQLRKEANANPEFQDSAQDHAEAISQESSTPTVEPKRRKKRAKRESLSKIYAGYADTKFGAR